MLSLGSKGHVTNSSSETAVLGAHGRGGGGRMLEVGSLHGRGFVVEQRLELMF